MLGRWLISSASNRVVARCSRSLLWRAWKFIAGEFNRRQRKLVVLPKNKTAGPDRFFGTGGFNLRTRCYV